nr:TPA_asm: m32.6 sORF 3 [Murid betaherpesvirus 1]DBA07956.1 TPA_asm: m32.6 sORF 3 [Murid betaherpesvirus 1]
MITVLMAVSASLAMLSPSEGAHVLFTCR